MLNSLDPTVSAGLTAARNFCSCSEPQISEIIYRLRQERSLTAAVRGLNRLLDDPEHRSRALAALRRMGLERGG